MTRPGLRTDAVLILIALGMVVIWWLIPRAPDDEFAATAWPDLMSDPPERITVSRGGERVSFAYRGGEHGQLERYVPTFPPETHANPATLDQLIVALSRIETVRRADAAARELGLDRPRVVLEIESSAGARRIELGSPAPSPPNASYAAVTTRNRRQLIVLAPESAQALDVPLDTLLDHRALDVVPSELQRLHWTGLDGRVELVRNVVGRWVFAASSERVRRRTLERLALAVSEIQFTKHVPHRLAAAAHEEGLRVQLELTTRRDGREEQFRLSVSGECPGAPNDVVLIVDGPRPTSGCVEAKAVDTLLPRLTALTDDAVFSLRADEIEQLEARGTKAPFTIHRQGSEFRIDRLDGPPVELAIGNGLLTSLGSLRGEPRGRCEFAARSGAPTIALKSYVVGDGTPVVEQVSLPVNADRTPSVCRDDGVELAIDNTSAQLLALEPSLFRSPVVLDLPPSDITEVRLSHTRVRLTLRADAQSRFTQLEPPQPKFDAASAEALRERLAHLRAARWLVPAATETLTRESLPIDLDLVVRAVADTRPDAGLNTATKHRLRVVLAPNARGFGWWNRGSSPFELEPELVEILTRFVREFGVTSAR